MYFLFPNQNCSKNGLLNMECAVQSILHNLQYNKGCNYIAEAEEEALLFNTNSVNR